MYDWLEVAIELFALFLFIIALAVTALTLGGVLWQP